MRIVVLVLTVLILGSCASTPATEAEQQQIQQIVNQQKVHIESDWALPLGTSSLQALNNLNLLGIGSNANRINLVGNFNYLEIKGDSVKAYLPYFGERRMGGGYGQNAAINFEGVPKDLRIYEEKGKAEARFTIDDEDSIENYQVSVTITPNLGSMIRINTAQRSPIAYEGEATVAVDSIQ